MSKKKSIAVAIILSSILLIGNLIAYYTDKKTTTNVFTIGDNISITLSESLWVPSNGIGIHPGTTVAKNPVISNASLTTPAYVFAEIIVPCYDSDGDEEADTALFKLNTIGSGWNLMSISAVNTTTNTITYVYSYGTSTAMTALAANTSTSAVFSSVTLTPSLTTETIEEPNIVVNAYGIQTDGLGVTTPSAIYALFNA